MDLVSRKRLEQTIGTKSSPCHSPIHSYSKYIDKQDSECVSCCHKRSCHKMIKKARRSHLCRLHEHLHRISALDEHEGLTKFGEISRLFPHSGGLLFARMAVDGVFNATNALEATELIASFSLASFKSPQVPALYRYPFASEAIENELMGFYPMELYPECYDTTRQGEIIRSIRDYNPSAGWIVREWIEGISWEKMIEQVTSDFFGLGDVTGLIYRSASFLQSVVQADIPGLSKEARELRRELLRAPVSILL